MRALVLVLLLGCSSEARSEPPVDAAPVADATDECAAPEAVTTLGDTCVSFGPGAPCDICGLPQYGYVCTNGGPDVPGCVRVRPESPLAGATYCCSALQCVRAPMLDAHCAGKKMVQCPEDKAGTLLAEPGTGCTKASVPPPYQWFCCP